MPMSCSTDYRSCPKKEPNHYLGVESVELIGELTEKAQERDEYLNTAGKKPSEKKDLGVLVDSG